MVTLRVETSVGQSTDDTFHCPKCSFENYEFYTMYI